MGPFETPEGAKDSRIEWKSPIIIGPFGIDVIFIRVYILPRRKSKIPGDGVNEFHVMQSSICNSKVPTVGAIGLLLNIPPCLTMCVNPTPLWVKRSAKGDVCSCNNNFYRLIVAEDTSAYQ